VKLFIYLAFNPLVQLLPSIQPMFRPCCPKPSQRSPSPPSKPGSPHQPTNKHSSCLLTNSPSVLSTSLSAPSVTRPTPIFSLFLLNSLSLFKPWVGSQSTSSIGLAPAGFLSKVQLNRLFPAFLFCFFLLMITSRSFEHTAFGHFISTSTVIS